MVDLTKLVRAILLRVLSPTVTEIPTAAGPLG